MKIVVVRTKNPDHRDFLAHKVAPRIKYILIRLSRAFKFKLPLVLYLMPYHGYLNYAKAGYGSRYDFYISIGISTCKADMRMCKDTILHEAAHIAELCKTGDLSEGDYFRKIKCTTKAIAKSRDGSLTCKSHVKQKAGLKRSFLAEMAKMRQVVESAIDERQWLLFAILATAGLRVTEAIELRKEDISGRILTLYKKGNNTEIAIIPKKVATRLAAFLENKEPDDLLFVTTRQSVYEALKLRRETPNGLRKRCITYWYQKKDRQMEEFVKRHKSLEYVIPPRPKKVFMRQKVMEQELWG